MAPGITWDEGRTQVPPSQRLAAVVLDPKPLGARRAGEPQLRFENPPVAGFRGLGGTSAAKPRFRRDSPILERRSEVLLQDFLRNELRRKSLALPQKAASHLGPEWLLWRCDELIA